MNQNPCSMERKRIAVTGIGIYCPIGKSPEEVMQNIRAGRGAIGPIRAFATDSLEIRDAAEIHDHDPRAHFSESEAAAVDRTAQLAIVAARQAVLRAALSPIDKERAALLIGICAGGQGDSNNPQATEQLSMQGAARFLSTAPYRQTHEVAVALGVHGPQATVSTACASSGSALCHAYDLLQAGKVRHVVAGGTDAFSYHTYAGFYALGAMAPRPSSPFSTGLGVTFGEGAGFVILETFESAQERGVLILGELVGYGATGDAHHMTSPDPSGGGLCRAISAAVRISGLEADQIDYVNAHGTGTRDNDKAESLAITRALAAAPRIPPVSSTKSFIGHTLGAAGILEFIISLLCQRDEVLPPTLNFEAPRPGCELDYIPNHYRPGRSRYFLSNSAAFGGINAVLVGGDPALPQRSSPILRDEVVISGLGVVSAVGCGQEAFVQALRQGRSGIGLVDRWDVTDCQAKQAALVKEFQPRALLPMLDCRRLDRLNQYVTVAAGLGLRDAGLQGAHFKEERVGVVVALARGPVGTQENFTASLRRDGLHGLSPKYFPSMVLSTVAGNVGHAYRLRGTTSLFAEGISGGLHGLIHAFELLRQTPELDALLVIAADELAPGFFRLYDRLGVLAAALPGDPAMQLYAPQSRGMVLGEGAVAVVLERASAARARGARPLAQLLGYGLSADAAGHPGLDPSGRYLGEAVRQALTEANSEVDVVYGHGRGIFAQDERELKGLSQGLAGQRVPLGCVMGNTGVAEAASGLFSVAAAVQGMQHGEVYPVLAAGAAEGKLELVRAEVKRGRYRRSLIAGSTESGNNAALVLASAAAGD